MHRQSLLLVLLGNLLAGTAAAVPTRDQLVAADYQKGRTAFQQRCSACHTLAEGGSNLVGPNLWGLIGRQAGTSPGFASSAALATAGFRWDVARVWDFLADPNQLIPGNRMMIPEPVPEADRTALVSFLLQETGAADWPRPVAAAVVAKADRTRSLEDRYPRFYQHLMTNTTRYRMETPSGEWPSRVLPKSCGRQTPRRA